MDGDLEVEVQLMRMQLDCGDYQGQEHGTLTLSSSPTLSSDGAFCLCPPGKGQVPDRRQGLPPSASGPKAEHRRNTVSKTSGLRRRPSLASNGLSAADAKHNKQEQGYFGLVSFDFVYDFTNKRYYSLNISFT